MKKKLLIMSFALSVLVSAQCNQKCGYNQDENGNTIHIKTCNVEIGFQQWNNYKKIFERNKTRRCHNVRYCLLVINENDTICWNHDRRVKKIIKKQLNNNGKINHYQFKRPIGSPYRRKKK